VSFVLNVGDLACQLLSEKSKKLMLGVLVRTQIKLLCYCHLLIASLLEEKLS